MMKLKLKAEYDGVRIRETPIDGKPLGQVYQNDILESLESDAETLKKVGIEAQWINIKTPDGISAYIAAWMLDVEGETPELDEVKTPVQAEPVASVGEGEVPFMPATSVEIDGKLYITVVPLADSLRLRAAPVDGDQVGAVNKGQILISLESPDDTRRKIGVEGQWLKVQRLFSGQIAYTAAWFVEAYTGDIPDAPEVPAALNITGVNLDILHPLGAPDPTRLTGMGWVRLGYNVSAGTGSMDIGAAYDRYKPYIEKCAKAGLKVMLVFTHQTYGEGRNEYWPWPEMNSEKWKDLTGHFTEMIGKIAQQYAGQDLVHAYQIWNEMDAHHGAVASVRVEPEDYGRYVLGQSIQALKAVDPTGYTLTGGHTGGPGRGGEYARITKAHLPAGVEPDGLAFHPYGRGITQPAEPYTIFGHIDDSMKAYLPIYDNKPVWITEWGVLDRPSDDPAAILGYASDLVKYMKRTYPNDIASMIWYAWAMSMHNGYGLVNQGDQPLEPFHGGFKNL